jgi:hypothetical protein
MPAACSGGRTGTERALLNLSGLASSIRAVFTDGAGDAPRVERRKENRRDFLGRKVIVRQYRALGIMHLRNVSRGGICGITDMPLAIGSIVFVELNRPHFYAAEVVWATNLRIGLALYKPLKPEMLDRLHDDHLAKKKVA